MQEALDMLEARPDGGADHPAHPPAVFESAKDYGEETVELESACRLLGDKCTYQVVQHIEARRQILNALQNPQ